MDAERHGRLQSLFLAACETAPEERAALLERECAGDAELRADVERLLEAHEGPDTFLDAPVFAASRSGTVAGQGNAAVSMPGSAAESTGGKLCPRCKASFPHSEWICPQDGEVLVDDPEWLVGKTVDGLYVIEALLGQGGMGTVYRARHVLLRDQVALKLLPRELGSNPAWLRRFVREGQAARRFRHPGAVTVYDLRAAEDGTIYLVLEYVEGRTLRAELKERKRMGAASAVEVLEQVAGVLEAAHRAGVVHRDLKPENVMVREDERGRLIVKVLDLGIAKLLEGASDTGALTRPGAALGTPAYMSPEQWGGGEIDGRADVYSLAIMAYELASGAVPFKGKNATAVRAQHLGTEAPALVGVVEDVGEAFSRAVARALAKDPSERTASAAQFARELRASVEGGVAVPTAAKRAGDEGSRTEVLGEATGERAQETMGGAARTGVDPPNNLPQQMTSFVGREREVAEVRRLADEWRLVTLVGPGGIGKTRLALAAARELLGDYEDGVWFVELAALGEGRLVARALADALGVQEQTGRGTLDALVDWARDKQALLVIDNCEQVLEASAEVTGTLLHGSGRVRVVATSREALGVEAEAVWPVPPLGVSGEGAAESDAVRLFADRARSVRPGFAIGVANAAAVRELCERLEGIPLAIELAAARAGVMTPQQLLARLGQRLDMLASRRGNVAERQRTLRASIEWSYQLLDEELREVFAQLSVFRGGWGLEAAEAVCGKVEGGMMSDESEGDPAHSGATDPPTHRSSFIVHPFDDVVEALDRLRESSMIVAEERGEEVRFRMLETLREFASERLEAAEAAALKRRHAEYYVRFAEEAETDLARVTGAVLARLEVENDNVRAALEWSQSADGDPILGLRLVATWWRYWIVRNYLRDGRTAIEAVLARCPDAPASLRASALNGCGCLAFTECEFPRAQRMQEEALELWRQLGNRTGTAESLYNLSNIACAVGDYRRGYDLAEESLAMWRALGDTSHVAAALLNTGRLKMAWNEYQDATVLLEESLALFRQQGDERGMCVALFYLASTAMYERKLERAQSLQEEGLALGRAMGYTLNTASSLFILGEVARHRGEYDRAEALHTEALALYRQLGAVGSQAHATQGLAAAACARGDFGRAASLYREALSLNLRLDSQISAAECLEGLAKVAAFAARPERAARLLGAMAALREAIDAPIDPIEQPELETAEAAARAALGDDAFEAARSAGRTLTLEQAAREALE